MYDDLVKQLRQLAEEQVFDFERQPYMQAADAIETLELELSGLRIFQRNISELPDCNTCLKKTMCEFLPKYGDYCRINCPHWLGEPPKEGEG